MTFLPPILPVPLCSFKACWLLPPWLISCCGLLPSSSGAIIQGVAYLRTSPFSAAILFALRLTMPSTTRSATSHATKQQARERGNRKRPPKHTNNARPHHGQRSSLRRALRESLRDASASISAAATATATTADSNISNVSGVASTTTNGASLSFASQDSVPLTPSSPLPSSSRLPPHTPLSRLASPEPSAEQQKHWSVDSAPPPGSAFLLTPESSLSSGPASTPPAPSLTPSSSLSPSGIASPTHSSFHSPPVSPVATAGNSLGVVTPRGSGTKRKPRSNVAATSRAEGTPSTSTPSRCRFRGGWHSIKEIVGEGRQRGALVYLVEWEGTNPSTGVMWPCSWVCYKQWANMTACREKISRSEHVYHGDGPKSILLT